MTVVCRRGSVLPSLPPSVCLSLLRAIDDGTDGRAGGRGGGERWMGRSGRCGRQVVAVLVLV